MDERARQARKEYYRQYRKNHPDKVKAAQERYWLRKAMAAEAAAEDLNAPRTPELDKPAGITRRRSDKGK